MPAISVIVPVYNVQNYLSKCINSILNQTFTDLEIILVDDGSTDNSGAICDEYANKDSRIKVIHKANGGLSDARNAGLDICTGDYIGFVDSDDWIALDMYETLYNFATKENLDVAMCGSSDVYDNRVIGTHKFNPIVLTNTEDIIVELFVNRRGGTAIPVWNRIYKYDVFGDIKFEKGKYFEDGYYLLEWIKKTKRFGRISDRKYFYLHRDGSITNNKINLNKLEDFRIAYENNLLQIVKNYSQCTEAGEYRLFFTYRAILNILSGKEEKYCDFIISKIKEHLRSIMMNRYNTWKQKLLFLIICFNIDIYFFLRKVMAR